MWPMPPMLTVHATAAWGTSTHAHTSAHHTPRALLPIPCQFPSTFCSSMAGEPLKPYCSASSIWAQCPMWFSVNLVLTSCPPTAGEPLKTPTFHHFCPGPSPYSVHCQHTLAICSSMAGELLKTLTPLPLGNTLASLGLSLRLYSKSCSRHA